MLNEVVSHFLDIEIHQDGLAIYCKVSTPIIQVDLHGARKQRGSIALFTMLQLPVMIQAEHNRIKELITWTDRQNTQCGKTK